jgi:hypothetical protein
MVPFRGFEPLPTKRPSVEGLQAGGKGFEPLQTDPESVVLPLDEPPKSMCGRYSNMPTSFRQGLVNYGTSAQVLINTQQHKLTLRKLVKDFKQPVLL